MTTVPRADLTDIAWRHGMDYDIDFDPTTEWVRAMASNLRRVATGSATAAELIAEANELDALATRYEEQAANAMWSHADGVNP